MKQLLTMILALLMSALLLQKSGYASCYAEFSGKYDDKNISLAVKTSSSSGQTNVGLLLPENSFSSHREKPAFIRCKNYLWQCCF